MKTFIAIFAFVMAFAALVHGQNQTTANSVPSEAPPSELSTGEPPVQSTVPSEVVTTADPEPPQTSQAPPETTLAPNSTTDAPPVETTTPEPEGTTGAPEVTTQTSGDLPDKPQIGTYQLSDPTSKQICILGTMGVRFAFNYTDKDNKSQIAQIDLPANATGTTVSGSCGDNVTKNEQNIQINFLDKWSLNFIFVLKNKQVYVETIELEYVTDEKYFPNIMKPGQSEHAKLENQTLFQASVNNSYLCNSQQNVNFTGNMASFETVGLQVQAFRKTNETTFGGDAQECSADAATSNIVPIAVGAALAALVVIVLIAYLISRHRNKGGYESV